MFIHVSHICSNMLYGVYIGITDMFKNSTLCLSWDHKYDLKLLFYFYIWIIYMSAQIMLYSYRSHICPKAVILCSYRDLDV